MVDVAEKRVQERCIGYFIAQVAMQIRDVKHGKAHNGAVIVLSHMIEAACDLLAYRISGV